jgi:hypothetical protein
MCLGKNGVYMGNTYTHDTGKISTNFDIFQRVEKFLWNCEIVDKIGGFLINTHPK